ncbi:DUF1214 domain-containing protein [Variovorax sp. M-6]|uniref:DUF1214 domain-containing protein n=1 Tax=Variovorax sp. M-6 TaxID=3233041 RepID=UPI003F947E3E
MWRPLRIGVLEHSAATWSDYDSRSLGCSRSGVHGIATARRSSLAAAVRCGRRRSSKAPEGKAGNWLATAPGKRYFTILRLYGPTEPAFDKSWKPGTSRG